MSRYSRYDRSYGSKRPRRARGIPPEGGYDADYGRYATPFPGAAGYPSARWGWGPLGWAGWGPGMGFWPYAAMPGYGAPAYGFDYEDRQPRRRPEESPTYGTGGDQALRRWGNRYGYDFAYSIQPRRRGSR
ncbi:hypothetical protein BH23GEM3_BH23GEM3_00990 [soil metagenome]|nr:hypothetical protein [Gemmatimonadota bacterium]